MTTPPQNPMQFIDPNNPLLAGGPARLDCGSITPPSGEEVGVVTIRTNSATVTVLLTTEDLRNWSGVLNALADKLGGVKKLQPASVMDVASLDTTMKRRNS